MTALSIRQPSPGVLIPRAVEHPAAKTETSSEAQPLSRRQWMGILAGFFGLAALCNWLLPLPDINDFEGLGRICLLMDRLGWLRCVNDNWGFAQSLSCYVLTKLTGNLLISQRVLGALGGLLALVSAERAMRVVLGVRSTRVRCGTLLAFILNSYMASALLSTHLDILPIGLCLLGLSMLTAKRPGPQVIAGLAMTAGTWFRFHFALFPLLYLALTLIVYRGHKPWKHAGWAALGVACGLAVPMVLCYAAHGVPMLSNQRLILAMLTPDFSWGIQYQLTLNQHSYAELFSQVRWSREFRELAWQFTEQPAILLLFVMLALEGLQALGLGKDKSKETARPSPRGRMAGVAWHLPVLCVVLALLPFAVLRGLTDRLPQAFVLIAFPFLAARVRWPWKGLWRHLTAAVVICCLLPLPALYERLDQQRRSYQIRYHGMIAAMSPDVRADRVFCAAWLPNQRDRYWLWSPAMYGGWTIRNREMREEFGVIDLAHAQPQAFDGFDYLILHTKPSTDYESFPPELLELGEVRKVGSMQVIANARKAIPK